MFGVSLIEWFGYIASIIVAVSLTMSSAVMLRWTNLVGASLLSAYGFTIGALPVGLLNGFIALTDVYYLIKFHKEKKLEVAA